MFAKNCSFTNYCASATEHSCTEDCVVTKDCWFNEDCWFTEDCLFTRDCLSTKDCCFTKKMLVHRRLLVHTILLVHRRLLVHKGLLVHNTNWRIDNDMRFLYAPTAFTQPSAHLITAATATTRNTIILHNRTVFGYRAYATTTTNHACRALVIFNSKASLNLTNHTL